MPIVSRNPATEKVLKTFSGITDQIIEHKLNQAQTAWKKWRQTDFAVRKKLMLNLAEVLKTNRDTYAKIITSEMGKPIKAAQTEIEKCAWTAKYYATQTKKWLTPQLIKTENSESYLNFDPLGVILAIMPWNFPFWQVMRFAVPAIMAGNVGLLKHASNVPQTALALEQVFKAAGFPVGVFQSLLINSDKIAPLISDHRIKAVTLTGSEQAGSQVASQAGKFIKKTVLELGGSDPFIVLNDADLPYACGQAVWARLQNTGQSCIAAKRFIVLKDVYEKFLKIYKQEFEKIVIGDPLNEKIDVGPLSSKTALENLANQVKKSLKLGARLITGGQCWGGKGYFYLPTIIADVKKGMPVYDEETFGPVAAVIKAKDEQEAIALANDTPYGLAASIWTKNISLAKKLASHLETGAVFINKIVTSDPRLPFGGIKKSGYGRELSEYGLKEFINIKTIVVK